MRSTLRMGQRVPPLNEHLFIDISGYLLAKDQPNAPSDLLYGAQSELSEHLLLRSRQSITSQTTGLVGEKDQPHVEIEEAGIDEEDGKSSKW